MNNTALAISRIKRLLDKVRPDKIQEVEDFVEFLSGKGSSGKGERKIAKLKGIWKGLGFEKLDLETEIKTTGKEFDESILRRSERWTT